MLFARKICAIGREKKSGREVGGEGSLPGVKARIGWLSREQKRRMAGDNQFCQPPANSTSHR